MVQHGYGTWRETGNVARDRWPGAVEVLDFYHASQHVWDLGEAVVGTQAARPWVEKQLHQLRHGRHAPH